MTLDSTEPRHDPEAATLQAQWHRLSPLSIVFFVFGSLKNIGLNALPGIIIGLAALEKTTGMLTERLWQFGIGAVALVAGFGLLSYLRFAYRIKGDRVLVRRGILHREELDIEFDRIQNLNLREPFYMRPFGLAVLALDTAGSSGKEVQLAGIMKPLALEIRNTVLARAEHDAGEGVGDTAEDVHNTVESAETVHLELNRRDVLLYGLTANFLLWAGVAMGTVFGSWDFSENTMLWFYEREPVQATFGNLQESGGRVAVIGAGVGLVFLVLLLLPIISMVGALFRYDGYRLTQRKETFRKSSGLLTRFDESVRQHKIQALVWKQNLMARLLGRINLQLRQASAGEAIEDGKLPTGSKSQFLVPALRPKEAAELSAVFLPQCMPELARYSGINVKRFTRIILTMIMIPVTLVVGAQGLLLFKPLLLLIPLMGMVAWWVIRRVARMYGWAVVDGYGLIRSGFIGRRVTIFPLFKVQRVDIQQSRFQARAGTAHLTVHLASHSLTLPHVSLKEVQPFRDLLLFHAESSRERWF